MENIEVALRIRPLNLSELNKEETEVWNVANGNTIAL